MVSFLISQRDPTMSNKKAFLRASVVSFRLLNSSELAPILGFP
jgi:hypothetical protein